MYVAWNDPEDVQTGIIAKGEFIKTWTLHVPKGTKEKYEKDRGWQDFGTMSKTTPPPFSTSPQAPPPATATARSTDEN